MPESPPNARSASAGSASACLIVALVLGLAACTNEPERIPTVDDEADAPLAGSAWTLAAFADAAGPDSLAAAEAPADSATAITAAFTDEGRLVGSAGCNRYTSAYTTSGDTLRLGRIVHTRQMCPPPQMQREQRYITVLPNVQRYRRTADSLVLLDAAGTRLLTFAAASGS